jgi:hypothetical protein
MSTKQHKLSSKHVFSGDQDDVDVVSPLIAMELYHFWALCEEQHFERAAIEQGMDKGKFSAAIKRLENTFGKAFFRKHFTIPVR